MLNKVLALIRLFKLVDDFLKHDIEGGVMLGINLNLAVEVFRVNWAVLIQHFADADQLRKHIELVIIPQLVVFLLIEEKKID